MEMSRNDTATNTEVTMQDSWKFNAFVNTSASDLHRGWRATDNCYTNRTLPLQRCR